MMPSLSHWYAVYCRHAKERQVAAALEQLLELSTYLPELRRRLHGTTHHSPLFPGYLFVQADQNQASFHRMNTIPGVIRIVAFDGKAQPIPFDVITSLQAQVEQLNLDGGVSYGFRAGDELRLKKGPLRGLEVVFQASAPQDRARVLIEFLGSLRVMDVDAWALERVHAVPQRHERRTRGGGRKIRNHM